MDHFICATCGTQFPLSAQPPAGCPICLDERQYIGWKGQQWTTLEQLRAGHHSILKEEEPGLTAIGTEPSFAIGQRAQLVQTPQGNVLWESLTVIDDAAIDAVRARGGLSAIAISHPHYYSSMVEWSHAFGGVPIFLHAAERPWVMRPDPAIVFWEGETQPLLGGLTLIRCGGHFEGAQVLHWPAGAEGRGVILAGDILYVVSDRRYLSFMYSYPNLIPLNAAAVRRIAQAIEPFAYDRIYSAWFDRTLANGAREAVARSVARYINAIGERNA
jgi:glyoxylase-like metal-dependent hydrolase (beta-lactamase superfamily II)